MVTIKDIAEAAGVSTMTVSRVVNGQEHLVAPQTRERINHFIRTLGYVPNSMARSLSSQNSKIITVVIRGTAESIRESYTAAMVSALVREIQKRGYYMMIHISKNLNDITSNLQSWRARGAVFLGQFEQDVNAIRDLNMVPMVFTDCYSDAAGINIVRLDDYHGGREAAKILFDNGHRIAGYVGFGLDSAVVSERLRGFRAYLDERGIEVPDSRVISLKEETNLVSEVRRLIGEGVTGALFSADFLASEAIIGLRKQGIEVPRDLSCIGFDDSRDARVVHPPLTTIAQDIDRKVDRAIEILFEHIKDDQTREYTEVLPMAPVIRDSVKDIR